MTEAHLLEQYCKRRLNSIDSLLQKPASKFSKKRFHKLRIDIKKMEAAADLLVFCSHAFDKEKILKPYTKVFKGAGAVRELQLEMTMLKKRELVDELKLYVKQRRKELKERKEMLFSSNDKKLLKKQEKNGKEILMRCKELTKQKLVLYVETKANEIDLITGRQWLKKEELHDLRKQLKCLYYIILVFCKNDDRFDAIIAFQELLGQWHDKVILKEMLQKAIESGQLEIKEKELLETIAQQLTAEGEELFEEITSQLTSLPQATQRTAQAIAGSGHKLPP